MPDKGEDNKNIALKAIKRNITLMNAVILLVVYTLIFLNVKFLYKFLDYIPQTSIITMSDNSFRTGSHMFLFVQNHCQVRH